MAITVTSAGFNNKYGTGTPNVLPSYNQSAGHCIVVFAQSQSASLPSISDTAGNIFSPILIADATQGSIFLSAWVCFNCLGNSSNVITIGDLTTYNCVEAWDCTGVNAVDITQTSNSSGSPNTINITTNYPNEAIISWLVQNSATLSSVTQPNGFTVDSPAPTGTTFAAGAHQIVSSLQSSINETWTFSASTTATQLIVSLYFNTALPQLIQSVSSTSWGVSGDVASLAFTNANENGSLLIAYLRIQETLTNHGTGTFSDSNGNTWITLFQDNQTTNSTTCGVFGYSLNAKSGSNTVKYTLSDGGGINFSIGTIAEYSGVLALDTYATVSGPTASTIPTSNTINLAWNDLVLFVQYNQTGAITIAVVPQGYTNLTALGNALGGSTSTTPFIFGNTNILRQNSYITSCKISTSETWFARAIAFLPRIQGTRLLMGVG